VNGKASTAKNGNFRNQLARTKRKSAENEAKRRASSGDEIEQIAVNRELRPGTEQKKS
jgi:hypothetical protein